MRFPSAPCLASCSRLTEHKRSHLESAVQHPHHTSTISISGNPTRSPVCPLAYPISHPIPSRPIPSQSVLPHLLPHLPPSHRPNQQHNPSTSACRHSSPPHSPLPSVPHTSQPYHASTTQKMKPRFYIYPDGRTGRMHVASRRDLARNGTSSTPARFSRVTRVSPWHVVGIAGSRIRFAESSWPSSINPTSL